MTEAGDHRLAWLSCFLPGLCRLSISSRTKIGDELKTAGTLCAMSIVIFLSGCSGQLPAPSGGASASTLATPTAPASARPSQVVAAAVKEGTDSFPKGSAVCNDSITDSNPLNIATATLSSDGKNLSVLITLDSPYPVQHGRAFRVVMGAVQHQEDYVAAIEETANGGVMTSVTDSQSGNTIQVPTAAASITNQKVTAEIPTADFPRLAASFTWKVEALSSGQSVDICPNENTAGVRVWLGFPPRLIAQ